MTTKLAVYDVNHFILNNTPVGVLLGHPGPIQPIIPIQQQPEMNQQNPVLPYLTYTYRTSPSGEQWWLIDEDVTYTVWGKSLDAINEVTNELTDVFRRLDESADDVNKYLAEQEREDYRFYYFRVSSTMSPDPTSQEGGRYGKPFSLRYQYSTNTGTGIA